MHPGRLLPCRSIRCRQTMTCCRTNYSALGEPRPRSCACKQSAWLASARLRSEPAAPPGGGACCFLGSWACLLLPVALVASLCLLPCARRLNNEDLPHLRDILNGISDEQYRRLLENVLRYNRAFAWDPEVGGQAFDYTIASLRRRWLNFKSLYYDIVHNDTAATAR